MQYKYLIIGAGPTGLGAGYRLKELGEEDFLILEKNDYPGGLSASFTDDKGFTWDIGGHILFSHYKYFDDLMDKALGADWIEHERESWIWIEDRFVPYPFQNNIRYLPKDSMWQCLKGLIQAVKAGSQEKPENFAQWINATFGSGIAEKFLLPYNFKVWAFHPRDMAYQWIGERVAVTDLEKVLKNILYEKDDFSWGPNNTFKFPLQGGTGAIWHAVARLTGGEHIKFDSKIKKIHPKKKKIELSTGETIDYEYLLSTMPLNAFVGYLDCIDSEFAQSVENLSYATSNIVGLGLKGKPKDELATKCWMYFPESNCPFYRVTVFSNYSPNNVPDNNTYWSLMTETSESINKPVNRSGLIEETIEGLLNTKLIESRKNIVSTWMFTAEHGYPVPTLKRDNVIATLIPALEKLDIYSRGRMGAWKYEAGNQDHSLMQGVEWVNRIVISIPEITYPLPSVANSNFAK